MVNPFFTTDEAARQALFLGIGLAALLAATRVWWQCCLFNRGNLFVFSAVRKSKLFIIPS
jgi:hypothetical protein